MNNLKQTIYFAVLACVACIGLNSCQSENDLALVSESEMLPLGTRSSSTLPFIKGADLSYVNELEDCGVTYQRNGTTEDVYEMMADYGANLVRLRLWHNATWTNYSNLRDVKKSAKRAKRAGMGILLDFHYSDTWTDPEQNTVPAAWLPVVNNLTALADSVYNYTYNTLVSMKASSVVPTMVQIGNETNKNIMVSDNSQLEPVNYSRNVTLFNAGLAAVADFNATYNKDVKTVLHVAMNPTDAMNWVTTLKQLGILDFDMLGLSYYPQWQGYTPYDLGVFTSQLLSTYNIKLLVAEIGHIWTREWNDNCHNLMSNMAPGYPETPCPQLQKDFLCEVKDAVRNNGGAGVIAWEPAWVSSSNVTLWGVGSNWENVTFFDFNNELLTHGGMEFFSENNVKVTFQVDMTNAGNNAVGYITGDFTADNYGNWQIIPMKRVGSSNVYAFTTYLCQGQEGAFYFLNGDDWSSREIVPVESQESWNDRMYHITNSSHSQNINIVWGTSNTF